MKIWDLDTPALIIDREILMKNLDRMQSYADAENVRLRPHTKTHKMPQVAKLQLEKGAVGIAVAKVGEAEVMNEYGIQNIFIANEIVGEKKLKRIAALSQKCEISFGIDSVYQINEAEKVFGEEGQTANVLIEVEVGEQRCGVNSDEECQELLDRLKMCKHVDLIGFFGHDGNTYNAADIRECEEISRGAQKRLSHYASAAKEQGFDIQVVSYGSTPPLVSQVAIEPGITEIRPGTYALMDVSQGFAQNTLDMCAGTILTTVISKPTAERVIFDVGAKGITMQERTEGICNSRGKGIIKKYPDVSIQRVFDEHAIVRNTKFHDAVQVGEKFEVIPVHICPVCNLYDKAFLVSGEDVVDILDVACRGKLQ